MGEDQAHRCWGRKELGLRKGRLTGTTGRSLYIIAWMESTGTEVGTGHTDRKMARAEDEIAARGANSQRIVIQSLPS